MGIFQNKDFDLLLNNVQIGIQNGVLGFDTAPSYKSEGVLGKVLKTLITKYVVLGRLFTKIFQVQLRCL